MWSRSRLLLLKIEIQFPLHDFSLLWPIDTTLAVFVSYIKTQLKIATQVSVIKVKVIVTKKIFSFRSITLVCFGPLTPNLVHATNATKNKDIIFWSLPSFISYSCHIKTWLNRWKPGFVALRRFLYFIYFAKMAILSYCFLFTIP